MKKIFLLLTFVSTMSVALADAFVTQKYWRWRNDNGSESSATWTELQNITSSQALCSSENLRLRMALYVQLDPTIPGIATKIMDYFISYSTSPTGPFIKLTKNSTTAPFILATSNNVAGGIATTKQLNWVETNPFNAGSIVDASRTSSLLVSTGSGSPRLTEFEWVIKKTAAAMAQTYYFKLEGLNAYETPLPSITLTEISTTVNATACESYNFYNSIISESGTYRKVLRSYLGCDSTIILNIVINKSTTKIINEVVCTSYNLNGTIYSQSGSYIQTLRNAAGCDSIITLNLTVRKPSSSELTITVCNNFILNNQNYTESGTYNQVIKNAAGCDSAITLNLTILKPTFKNITESACGSFTLNGQTYNKSGNYNQTLQNANGCDSIITLNLKVNSAIDNVITEKACGSYSLNGMMYVESGMYTQIIKRPFGCDSTIKLNLTLVKINPTIKLSGSALFSEETNASFQWVDCSNNYASLINETNQQLNIPKSGSYAVIVNKDNCKDTSNCSDVIVTGTLIEETKNVLIYPSPVSSFFSIEMFSGSEGEAQLLMINATGMQVYSESFNVMSGLNTRKFDSEKLARGAYVIKIVLKDKVITEKIILK